MFDTTVRQFVIDKRLELIVACINIVEFVLLLPAQEGVYTARRGQQNGLEQGMGD